MPRKEPETSATVRTLGTGVGRTAFERLTRAESEAVRLRELFAAKLIAGNPNETDYAAFTAALDEVNRLRDVMYWLARR